MASNIKYKRRMMSNMPKKRSVKVKSNQLAGSESLDSTDVSNIIQALISQNQTDTKKAITDLCETRAIRSIPLDPVQIKDCDLDQSIQSVKLERAILNEVSFLFLNKNEVTKIGNNLDLLDTIQELSGRFGEAEGVTSTPDEIFDLLIIHMNRFKLAADCYTKLNLNTYNSKEGGDQDSNSTIHYPNFMFIPVKPRSKFVNPTIVDIFVMHGCVHATISMTIPFGLFLKIHLKEMGALGKQLVSMRNDAHGVMRHCASSGKQFDKYKPWISLDVVVNIRISFDNGNSIRLLSFHPASV